MTQRIERDFSEFAPNQPISPEAKLYFEEMLADERIDRKIERDGVNLSTFKFEAETDYIIHEQLLPPNHITDTNKRTTAYRAIGEMSNDKFHLELFAADGGEPKKITIDSNGIGGFYLFDKSSPYIETLSQEEMQNLSFKAANLLPNIVKQAVQYFKLANPADFMENMNGFWEELTQNRQGSFNKTGYVSKELSRTDDMAIAVRLFQEETEAPQESILKIILEHSSQMINLDAEQVYRLELTYKSTESREQLVDASKRIESDLAKRLVSTIATSVEPGKPVKKLDTSDPQVMNQFRASLELLLND